MAISREQYFRAAKVADVEAAGRLVVQVDGHAIVLFAHADRIYAVDNRCPHMGFPLHRGTLKDGILTCHWHHARFDLASGGTFDQFADDVRVFPVQIRDSEVWVDLAPRVDPRIHQRDRLRDGLERDIPLVIAKAVITLLEAGDDQREPFRVGLEFGARYRQAGWGQGLTILTCMNNLLPFLSGEDRARALYHGLSAVARDSAGSPPRFELRPLPTTTTDVGTLARWFRQFVEVRDAEGAERCVVSAVRAGADSRQMAQMLFAAATDHRYIDIGHPLDFTAKAFEALDVVGWDQAELVLTSLTANYANADRMEESNEWRNPIDLVAILEHAFEELPAASEAGRSHRGRWAERTAFLPVLLGEDPQAIADGLLAAIREGCGEVELASVVAYAAALRLAQFHTSNEFTDWDTALHTFTFANAVQQGLQRAPSPALIRGVFDAAMSVYLDRFLNVPPAHLPGDEQRTREPNALLEELRATLDRQQQVNEAGGLVARYLRNSGEPAQLLTTLGSLLLREDRNFHTIQAVEAAFRQYTQLQGSAEGTTMLVAAGRYLAAHAPTMRAQGQTFQIANRLHRGERLYEEPDRILATVLLADIVGSTERAAALGDRRWRILLTSYHALIRAEVTRHRGQAVDTTGDGCLAIFDSPARAIRSALALRDAIRRLGLEVRIGVHTGEVERMDERVGGITVHIGARVMTQAGPGEIVVTHTVKDLVTGSGLSFVDRGTKELQGVGGEWHLFAVDAGSAAPTHPLS